MLHSQVTRGIQNQRQEMSAISHSGVECEISLLDVGLRIDGWPALQFGECVFETLSTRSVMGNLERHKRDRVVPSIMVLCVSESIDHVPANIPHSFIPLNSILLVTMRRLSKCSIKDDAPI